MSTPILNLEMTIFVILNYTPSETFPEPKLVAELLHLESVQFAMWSKASSRAWLQISCCDVCSTRDVLALPKSWFGSDQAQKV